MCERPKGRSVHRAFSEERERGVREVALTHEHHTVGESVAQRKWVDVSLLMEANKWSRAEGTCHQAEFFALYWVERSEVAGGCRGVDTIPIIKFGGNKRFVEAEEGLAIGTPRDVRKMA